MSAKEDKQKIDALARELFLILAPAIIKMTYPDHDDLEDMVADLAYAYAEAFVLTSKLPSGRAR